MPKLRPRQSAQRHGSWINEFIEQMNDFVRKRPDGTVDLFGEFGDIVECKIHRGAVIYKVLYEPDSLGRTEVLLVDDDSRIRAVLTTLQPYNDFCTGSQEEETVCPVRGDQITLKAYQLCASLDSDDKEQTLRYYLRVTEYSVQTHKALCKSFRKIYNEVAPFKIPIQDSESQPSLAAMNALNDLLEHHTEDTSDAIVDILDYGATLESENRVPERSFTYTSKKADKEDEVLETPTEILRRMSNKKWSESEWAKLRDMDENSLSRITKTIEQYTEYRFVDASDAVSSDMEVLNSSGSSAESTDIDDLLNYDSSPLPVRSAPTVTTATRSRFHGNRTHARPIQSTQRPGDFTVSQDNISLSQIPLECSSDDARSRRGDGSRRHGNDGNHGNNTNKADKKRQQTMRKDLGAAGDFNQLTSLDKHWSSDFDNDAALSFEQRVARNIVASNSPQIPDNRQRENIELFSPSSRKLVDPPQISSTPDNRERENMDLFSPRSRLVTESPQRLPSARRFYSAKRKALHSPRAHDDEWEEVLAKPIGTPSPSSVPHRKLVRKRRLYNHPPEVFGSDGLSSSSDDEMHKPKKQKYQKMGDHSDKSPRDRSFTEADIGSSQPEIAAKIRDHFAARMSVSGILESASQNVDDAEQVGGAEADEKQDETSDGEAVVVITSKRRKSAEIIETTDDAPVSSAAVSESDDQGSDPPNKTLEAQEPVKETKDTKSPSLTVAAVRVEEDFTNIRGMYPKLHFVVPDLHRSGKSAVANENSSAIADIVSKGIVNSRSMPCSHDANNNEETREESVVSSGRNNSDPLFTSSDEHRSPSEPTRSNTATILPHSDSTKSPTGNDILPQSDSTKSPHSNDIFAQSDSIKSRNSNIVVDTAKSDCSQGLERSDSHKSTSSVELLARSDSTNKSSDLPSSSDSTSLLKLKGAKVTKTPPRRVTRSKAKIGIELPQTIFEARFASSEEEVDLEDMNVSREDLERYVDNLNVVSRRTTRSDSPILPKSKSPTQVPKSPTKIPKSPTEIPKSPKNTGAVLLEDMNVSREDVERFVDKLDGSVNLNVSQQDIERYVDSLDGETKEPENKMAADTEPSAENEEYGSTQPFTVDFDTTCESVTSQSPGSSDTYKTAENGDVNTGTQPFDVMSSDESSPSPSPPRRIKARRPITRKGQASGKDKKSRPLLEKVADAGGNALYTRVLRVTNNCVQAITRRRRE